MTYAKIIADSISPEGVRLTTAEVRLHRFVLSEFNTHRTLSKNSASSRAIPVAKQIARIEDDLMYPVTWPAEQKGMQGGDSLTQDRIDEARRLWTEAAQNAIATVRALTGGDEKVHKSVANRLLEPFMGHTIVVTGTAFGNFFDLRLDTDAQPEIRVAAEALKTAFDLSEPVLLHPGQWHLPYVGARYGDDLTVMPVQQWARVSAARCARTSFLTQDGVRDLSADLGLYDRLITDRAAEAKALHWSPLEHQGTPWAQNRQVATGLDPLTFTPLDGGAQVAVETGHLPRVGNLLGWRSLRTEVEARMAVKTYR